MTSSILILFAHPALEKSRVNRVLIDEIRSVEGVTFHDLYEAYPDLDIDVRREQELLAAHDVIVLQHPFFWYSTPAILKEWQDLVLTHGWAYGTGGLALAGKLMLTVVTTGGGEAAYCEEGYNRFTVRQLLAPIEQTARLCRMDYLAPFVVFGSLGMKPEQALEHAGDYRRVIEALRDGRLDPAATRDLVRINRDLDGLIQD
jgi:glutathione-regulated potassium-efflux system ancillary protein KefG